MDIYEVEKEIMMTHRPFTAPVSVQSDSPDMRYLICGAANRGKMQVIRIDFHGKEWEVIYESDDAIGHIQVCPHGENRILFQHNPGLVLNEKFIGGSGSE